MPYPKVSPEVVVAISFGIVMFFLAVVSVWQGQKHRHDFGSDEEDQRGRYWPGFSGSSATRSTADQLLTIGPSFDPSTPLNVFVYQPSISAHLPATQRTSPAAISYRESLPQLPTLPPPTYFSSARVDASHVQALKAVPTCDKESMEV